MPVCVTPAPMAAHRVVCLGDSQVANNQDVTGTDRIWNSSLGWMGWFQQRTNQTLDWVGNYGFGGQQLPTIITQGLDAALSHKPGWMFMNGGGNDLSVGLITVAALKERIGNHIESVLNRGINVVWIHMPPSTAGSVALANSNHEINGWLKGLTGRYRGFFLCDMARYCSDTNGYLASAYTSDNTHFNAAGGYRGGQALFDVLGGILPRVNRLPSSNSVQELTNLNLNTLMAGTAGSISGAGVSGVVADSYALSDLGSGCTVVASKQAADAADPDQCPWQRLAISARGTAGCRFAAASVAATALVNDGNRYESIMEIRVTPGFVGDSAGGGGFIQGGLRMENAGTSVQYQTRDMFINNSPQVWPGESAWLPHRQWVSKTFPGSIPTGFSITQLRGHVDIRGEGTVDVRRVAVRRYRDAQ